MNIYPEYGRDRCKNIIEYHVIHRKVKNRIKRKKIKIKFNHTVCVTFIS